MSNIVKIGDKYYDFATRNQSFLLTAKELKTVGIKNYYFMLEVKHPEFGVQDLDPYDKNLTAEDIGRIITECKHNPWYFFREVARVPVPGAGNVPAILLRPSAAAIWCFMNSVDFLLCQPRQTFKTTWCTIILEYGFLFTYKDVKIPMLHLKLEKVLKFASQLRDYICALPSYMNPWSDLKKLPGPKSIRYEKHNTQIIPLASADSDVKAGDILRGDTIYMAYIDEYEYLKHFMSIMEGGTPAIISGREIGRKYNLRTCVMMLSTPGNLETEEGRQAQRMIDMTPVFNEQMYDLNQEELSNFFAGMTLLDSNGDPQPVTSLYIEYNYKQCRKSDAWLREQYKEAMSKNKIDEYKRGVLLQRYRGSSAVLFAQGDIDYIQNHVREPDHVIFLLKKYNLYVYNHDIQNPDLNSDTPYFDTQIPYLIGNDVAAGGDGDNTTFCIVHPYTLEIVGELISPYIGTLDHMRLIIELAKLIPRGVFCLETNSIGKAIVDFIQESQLESRFYHDPQLDITKNAIMKETNESAIIKHKAQQKKYIGTYVTAKVRENMVKLLIRYVKEYRQLINTKYVVKDLMNLERGKNGKVAAADGEHDDMIMAYMHTLYVLHYGSQLNRFGIDKTKCSYEKVYDELQAYEEHVAEETINNVVPYKDPNAFENHLLDDLMSGGSNAMEYANGGTDVYGYSHEQYNRSIQKSQQQIHPTDVLDASDYAFFNSVNSMLF
jgi:hypothetical protein